MTDKLPPPLLALFAPRPPLRYIPPQDADPEVKASTKSKITGLAAFLPALDEYKATDEYYPTESWLQRKDRLRWENQQKLAKVAAGDISDTYNPSADPQVRGDAFKTLFIGRLGYDVKESDLEREFGRFGPIERIRIVKNEHEKNPKKNHKGYAFIVYEREKDMKAAYKETDGIRIKDRRVLVDVERGRTVKGWKPRRLGGGLGGRGYTKTAPARPGGFGAPSGPGNFGGGFRGGFGGRGGFRGGFRGGDRGFGRGGVGYQGGGGFGGRNGGYQNGANPPAGAPSGPGGRSGGYGGYGGGQSNGDSGRNGYGDRDGYRGGGGRFGDGQRGGTGSNREPVQARDRGFGGDRDRDRDRERDRDRDRDRYNDRRDDDHSRKRYHDDSGYDDPRQKRRY